MQTFWQDLRCDARLLFKRPAFTLTILVTPALGAGAGSTVAALLKPWPGAAQSTRAIASGIAEAPIRRFTRAVNLEETSETSANASMGDLDGDGYPDIAAARSDAPNAVYLSGAP